MESRGFLPESSYSLGPSSSPLPPTQGQRVTVDNHPRPRVRLSPERRRETFLQRRPQSQAVLAQRPGRRPGRQA